MLRRDPGESVCIKGDFKHLTVIYLLNKERRPPGFSTPLDAFRESSMFRECAVEAEDAVVFESGCRINANNFAIFGN